MKKLIDEKINDWDDCLNRHYAGEIQNSDVLIRAALSDMEQLKSSLPKPVEVPEFVARWYEEHRHNTLEAKFRRAQVDKDERVRKWYENCQGRHVNKRANAQEVIAKMELSGYTVLKEPKVHDIKIKPNFLADIVSGVKTFEIRKNDRGYKKGDILNLQEFENDEYTGNEIKVKVTYIPEFDLPENYVVMGIEPMKEEIE